MTLFIPSRLDIKHSCSKRELQHGFGPAGCAVLLQARFDERLDCPQVAGLGGEEGGEADRASDMLELPLGATVFGVKG